MFWNSKKIYVDNTEAMQKYWNCTRQVNLPTIFLHNFAHKTIAEARMRVSDKEQPVMSAIYG